MSGPSTGALAGADAGRWPRVRRTAYAAGRCGVVFIPVLAALAVLGGVVSTGAFTRDPARYASFAATRWTSPMSLALTTATVVAAGLGALGLGLLLAPTRARWLALPGAALAVGGAVMMGVSAGSVLVRAPGAARGVLDSQLDQFALNPAVRGTSGAVLTVVGAAVITLGWIVLGAAVIRAPVVAVGDGAALIVAAPVVFLGGFFLRTLPTIGGLLLGAAGLGLAVAAGRLAPWRLGVVGPPRAPRSDLDLSALFTSFAAPAEDAASGETDVAAHNGHATADRGETVLVPAVLGPGNGNRPAAGPAGTTSRSGYRNGRVSRFSRGIAAWQVNRRTGSGNSARRPDGGGTPHTAKGGNAKPRPPHDRRRRNPDQ